MKKTSLVLILVLAMLASLSVPAVASEWALPYEGEPVTLRVMGWESYADVDEGTLYGQWFSEQFGTVNIEYEIAASDTATLINLYMASGDDMPDIMLFRDAADFANNYGDGSRSLNLLDYAEYMPEYTARRETYNHLRWYDTQDGAAYLYFPTSYNAISEVWFQNQALMDKYGLETPTNYEEMKACMQVVCDAEANVDGMIFIPWGFTYIFGTYSSLFGTQGIDPATVSYNYGTGKWEYPLLTNEAAYKTAVENMAEAYKNGWINVDFSTWEGSVADAKMINGEFLFTNHYYNEGTSKFFNNGVDVSFIDPPAAEGVQPFVYAYNVEDQTGWMCFISNTTKYPELCAAYLEFIGSENNAVGVYWGVEGESYTINEDGKRAYTQAYLDMDNEARKTTYGIANNPPYSFIPFVSSFHVGDAIASNFEKPSLDALTISAEKLSIGEYETYYAALKPLFDEFDAEDIAVIETALKTYVAENLTKFVLGTKDIAEWDSFISGLSQYGDIDELLEMYNGAEQRPLRKQQADRQWMTP